MTSILKEIYSKCVAQENDISKEITKIIDNSFPIDTIDRVKQKIKESIEQAKKLKAKEQISVVFMAMTISMWKYQKVYELFKADSRFKTVIVLSPCMGYSKEQQMRDVKNMRTFFNNLKCFVE